MNRSATWLVSRARDVWKSTALICAAVLLSAHPTQATSTCTGVDGVIGADWSGVTPTFVDYTDGSAPGAMLVDFNVYVRADATCMYVAAEALPASGDQWDQAYNLSLGSSANIYIDTDLSGSSDLIVLPLGTDLPPFDPGYCDAADTICNTTNFGASGPNVYSAGNDGAPNPSPVGGVREIGIPWSVLQNDPDGIGFPKAVCSVNVRTVQAFGYNFSGSQFGAARFGTVSQPGCVPSVGQPAPALSPVALVLMSGLLPLVGCWHLRSRIRRGTSGLGRCGVSD